MMIGLRLRNGCLVPTMVEERAQTEWEGTRFYTRYVGICGSDLQRMRLGPSVAYLGHEAVGMAEGMGPVVLNPNVACGTCEQCRSGMENLCSHERAYGTNVDGAFRGYLDVPEQNLKPLSACLPHFVLCDSLAVVMHAINLSQRFESSSRHPIVLGDGNIARLLVFALNRRGLIPDVLTRTGKWPHQDLLEANSVGSYEDAGLDVAGKYDLLFECVGFSQARTLEASLRCTRPGASLFFLGVYPETYLVPLRLRSFFELEYRIYGVRSFLRKDFTEAVRQMELHLDEFTEAFPLRVVDARNVATLEECLRRPSESKIVVDFSG